MHLLSIGDWRGSFALKIMALAVLLALGELVFWQNRLWAGGQGIFGLGIVAALALARPAVRKDRRARLALALAALYALAQLWDPGPLAFVLFWVAVGLATLLPGRARFDDGWHWFQRLVVHGTKSLVGPVTDLVRLNRASRRMAGGRRGLHHRLALLAVPVLGGLVFLWLFALANPVIARLIEQVSLPDLDWLVIPHFLLLGFLGLISWGVLRPRPPRRTFGTFEGAGDLALPGFSIASVTLALVVFNALFAFQNGLDLAYLTGLAALPSGISLAQYAHQGAYPLVATALLAALFVLVALRPGSRSADSAGLRRLVTLWIGQNLVLVASAAWRTWDYVLSYDLTRLRLAALLWMALVATGLVLVLWRMLKAKSASWLINANLVTSGVLLTAVCFVDLGAVAAQWNVRHAREIDGTGARLDLCYLARLNESAFLSVVDLEQRQLPDELGRKVSGLRKGMESNLTRKRRDGGWSVLLDHRLATARKFPPRQPVAEAPERLQCDDIID